MIAMFRQFITDPDCVNKACAATAMRFARASVHVLHRDDPTAAKPLRCSVNPRGGRIPAFDVSPETIRPQGRHRRRRPAGGGRARCAERGKAPSSFKGAGAGGTLLTAGANRLKGVVRRYAERSVRTTDGRRHRRPKKHRGPRALVCAKTRQPSSWPSGVGPFIYPDIPGIKAATAAGAERRLASDGDLGKKTTVSASS
jgi:hypothetical protein